MPDIDENNVKSCARLGGKNAKGREADNISREIIVQNVEGVDSTPPPPPGHFKAKNERLQKECFQRPFRNYAHCRGRTLMLNPRKTNFAKWSGPFYLVACTGFTVYVAMMGSTRLLRGHT